MLNQGENYIHAELTGKIIGACITVHKQLGPGYEEIIYQRALSRELWKQSIEHAREQWLDILYDTIKVGKKRVDFIVGSVIVELKAKSQYEPRDFIQTMSYLKASRYELALLINFGATRVEIKQIINQYSRNNNKFGTNEKT